MILTRKFGKQEKTTILTFWQSLNHCLDWDLRSGISTMTLREPLNLNIFFKNLLLQLCSQDISYKRNLTLSVCSRQEFTCSSGECITMAGRCDRRTDCEDRFIKIQNVMNSFKPKMFRSDEENCQLVVPSLDYKKDQVPQPLSGESRLQLNSSLIITNILYINELEGYFKATINYKKMWYDRSLTFQNLKQDQTNYLTLNDGIWTPYVMVLNMEAKEDCKEADIKTLFEVIYYENSTYIESKASEHLNTYLYKGSENPINHESYWTCRYVCQFDYHWYPFDTQICKIKLNVSELELELKADFTRYAGMYFLFLYKPFTFTFLRTH